MSNDALPAKALAPTPLTDQAEASAKGWYQCPEPMVMAEFARSLERERDAALTAAHEHFRDSMSTAKENAALRESLRELQGKLNVGHGCLPLSQRDSGDYRSQLEAERDAAQTLAMALKVALGRYHRESGTHGNRASAGWVFIETAERVLGMREGTYLPKTLAAQIPDEAMQAAIEAAVDQALSIAEFWPAFRGMASESKRVTWFGRYRTARAECLVQEETKNDAHRELRKQVRVHVAQEFASDPTRIPASAWPAQEGGV